MSTDVQSTPCGLVIFGATGDLTRRKLVPALFNLATEGHLPKGFTLIGYGRSRMTDQQFHTHLLEGVKSFSRTQTVSDEDWKSFTKHTHYVSGGYGEREGFNRLQERMRFCDCRQHLYYLALPPSAAEDVLKVLPETRLPKGGSARIMMEKPFGSDLESARRLNDLLGEMFEEGQIYRVDHYLAKDTVRNLMVFRFGNAIFEPIWNRNYIDHVQITAAEEIGVEGRGGYYEEAGVVRDMLQNHVLQVLALCAMEPPLAGDNESVRDKKVEIFKSLAPLRRGDYIFGQYNGYRQEENVSPDSTTPTYAAMRLFIENWRWQGVPFYLRAGKALNRKVTEVIVRFKRAPLCTLDSQDACRRLESNRLVIRLQPDESIALRFNLQTPGHGDDVGAADLDFHYASLPTQPGEAYEKVILDAMQGRSSLFWRSDGIEAAWQAVTPLLEDRSVTPVQYPNYEPGSWGPNTADGLLRRVGRSWQNAE